MTLKSFTPSEDQIAKYTDAYFKKINSIFLYMLLVFYFLGIAIAFYYQNFLLSISMGFASLMLFIITKKIFPCTSTIYKNVAGISLALFYLQYTLQTYGSFYIHFVFFLYLITLTMFQDWKVLFSFFFAGMLINLGGLLINFTGHGNSTLYFTQSVYQEMTIGEWIITYLIDCVHFVICIFTANYLKNQNLKNIKSTIYLEDQLNIEANTQLAFNISQNNLDSEYKLNKNDVIGKALFNMRENLKNIYEKNSINQWINDGISTITESLIDNNNVEELANNVLNKIVTYIGALQACFYIISENEAKNNIEHLEMVGNYGCSAEEKEKLNKVLLGESLIGEAAIQKKSILIENPPEDYIHINSGLGKAKPVNIIIVPLKFHDALHGIIEIASFQKLKKYEVEFLETVAEKIAISLNAAKSKFKTNQLLKDAHLLNEQLKSQEEAMRLNMEIMSSTQSEIARINSEMEGTLAAINMSLITVELKTDGTIININKNFKDLTGYSFQDVRGTKFNHYFVEKTDNDFWEEILKNTIKSGMFLIKAKNNDEKCIRGIFSIINSQKKDSGKIFLLCADVTDEKNNQAKLKETLTLYEEKEDQLNRMEAKMHNQMEYLNSKIEAESEQKDELHQLLQQKNEQILALESEILSLQKEKHK